MWRKHGKTNDGGCSAPVTALKGDPRYSKVSQLYNIPLIPNICTFYWRENTTILIDLRGSQRLEFITGNKTPSSSSVPIALRCAPFFSSKLAFLVDLETKGANCILWRNLHNFMTVHIIYIHPFHVPLQFNAWYQGGESQENPSICCAWCPCMKAGL